jgi:hypothetical protein
MAVVVNNGRFKSERTDRERVEEITKAIAGLSKNEIEVLREVLKELATDDSKLYIDEYGRKEEFKIVDIYREAEYEREVVDVETWLHDPYYMGDTGNQLWPQLEKDFIEMFSGPYHEAILTGAIGWGKTFFSNLAICRMLYEISCLRNPQKSYGQSENQQIAIVNYHVTEKMAKKVVFTGVVAMLVCSPYFKEHFDPKITSSEIRFPKNVWLAPLSSARTGSLGLNIFGGVIDESNFKGGRRTKQEKAAHAKYGIIDDASLVYNSVIRRMRSRFGRTGRLPGILLLPSSKQTEHDFTQKRILESRDDPTLFVRDYAIWDVQPPERFSKNRFQVFVGVDAQRSRVLDQDEDFEMTKEMEDEGCTIIEVPEDFRFDFEKDIDDALRDMAGIATMAVRPFIVRREKIFEAINDNMAHPTDVIEWNPNLPIAFNRRLMVAPDSNGKIRPIISPKSPRFVHIDPSLTGDATGFAMGHVSGMVNVSRRDKSTGKMTSEKAPVIVIDFAIRIIPPQDDEIDLGTGRQLVYILTEMGYPIRYVSMDSFQSIESKQKLVKKGYKAEIVSVDRSKDPYKILKEALYENRIVYYRYAPLIQELKGLVDDETTGKIDHLDKGSKDISDAVCGVCYGLTTVPMRMPLPIMKSIEPISGSMREYDWVVRNKNLKPKGKPGKPKKIMPSIIMG